MHVRSALNMLGSPFASLRRSAVVFSGDLGSPSPSAAGRVGGERSQHRRPVDLPLARGRHACSTLHITSANLPLARLPSKQQHVTVCAALLLFSGFCTRVRGINNSDTVVSVTCDDTSDGVCVCVCVAQTQLGVGTSNSGMTTFQKETAGGTLKRVTRAAVAR